MKRLLYTLFVTFLVLVSFQISVRAEGENTLSEATDFKYEIQDGEITITGISEKGLSKVKKGIDLRLSSEDKTTYQFRELTIPSTIDGKPVTKIKGHAFEDPVQVVEDLVSWEKFLSISRLGYSFNRIKIEKVSLPNGISEIGDRAFFDCNLTGDILLPSNLKSIGDFAFGCAYDADFAFPNGLREIGRGAFMFTGIEDLKLPSSITQVSEMTFAYTKITDLKLPETIEKVGPFAFMSCRYLESVYLPDSVKEIGIGAFIQTTALSKLRLSSSLKEIPIGAFADREFNLGDKYPEISLSHKNILAGIHKSGSVLPMENLKSGYLHEIIIPEGVEKIGDYAFYGYSTTILENTGKDWSISLPDSLKEVGDYAFSWYLHIENVSFNLPEGLKKIGKSGLGVGNRQVLSKDYAKPIRLKLPDSLEELSESSFSGTAIVEVKFPENPKFDTIPDSCFANTCIRELTIPEGIKTIGNKAFNIYINGSWNRLDTELDYGEKKLMAIKLPQSLENIGSVAFMEHLSSPGGTLYIPANVKVRGRNSEGGWGKEMQDYQILAFSESEGEKYQIIRDSFPDQGLSQGDLKRLALFSPQKDLLIEGKILGNEILLSPDPLITPEDLAKFGKGQNRLRAEYSAGTDLYLEEDGEEISFGKDGLPDNIKPGETRRLILRWKMMDGTKMEKVFTLIFEKPNRDSHYISSFTLRGVKGTLDIRPNKRQIVFRFPKTTRERTYTSKDASGKEIEFKKPGPLMDVRENKALFEPFSPTTALQGLKDLKNFYLPVDYTINPYGGTNVKYSFQLIEDESLSGGEAKINRFKIGKINGEIDQDKKEILIYLDRNMKLSDLKHEIPSINYTGETIDPDPRKYFDTEKVKREGMLKRDFINSRDDFLNDYVLTDENGKVTIYTIRIEGGVLEGGKPVDGGTTLPKPPEKPLEKEFEGKIESFVAGGIPAEIDEDNGQIILTLPQETDASDLLVVIKTSPGSSIIPGSGHRLDLRQGRFFTLEAGGKTRQYLLLVRFSERSPASKLWDYLTKPQPAGTYQIVK